MANLRRILWYLLGGTRGGPTRVRILQEIRERPYNTNQLAERLDLDYKTVQHHLGVLTEHRVLAPSGDAYGAVYLPTADMEASWGAFDEIVGKLDPADEAPDAGTDAGVDAGTPGGRTHE